MSHRPPLSRPCPFEPLEPRLLLTFVASAAVDTINANQGFDFVLNQPVTGVDEGDAIVENLSGGWVADRDAPGWGVIYDGSNGHLRVDINEAGASAPTYLPDGNYEVLLNGSDIFDAQGRPLGDDYVSGVSDATNLFFLNGDFNRDRVVDDLDRTILQASYGSTSSTFATGDATGDSRTNLNDFVELRNRYGISLPLPPSGPNNLSAWASSSDQVNLNWTVPTWDYDGFRVWRGTDAFDQEMVAELRPGDYGIGGTFANWADTGLQDGTKYWYRVRSFTDADGSSQTTNKVSAVTVLPAPENLAPTFLDDGSVLLSWGIAGTSQTHFAVQYSPDGGATWLAAGDVGGSQPYFVATDLPGTLADAADYQYRVRAEMRDDGGAIYHMSAWSLPVEPDLAAPSGLAAVPADPGELELNWNFDNGDQNRQRVEYSVDGGVTWVAPDGGILGGYDDSYVLSDVPDGSSYSFRVRNEFFIENDQGTGTLVQTSPWSATSAAAYLPLLAPSGVNATAVTPSEIRIDWTDNSAAEVGYRIERRLNAAAEPWNIGRQRGGRPGDVLRHLDHRSRSGVRLPGAPPRQLPGTRRGGRDRSARGKREGIGVGRQPATRQERVRRARRLHLHRARVERTPRVCRPDCRRKLHLAVHPPLNWTFAGTVTY